MSFLLRLLGFKKDSPEDLYLKGMDAFTAKNYQNALYYFGQAHKKSRIYSTKVNALINSATINENVGKLKEASDFYYKAALEKASFSKPNSEIIDLLTKAYRQRVKAERKDLGHIVAPLMLFAIANQDFSLSQRGYNRIKDLPEDPMIKLAVKAWELAKSRDTGILDSKVENLLNIPSNFPQEMSYIIKKAFSVIKAYSVVEAKITTLKNKIRAGDQTDLLLEILAHNNVEIQKLILNVGNKGIITKFPKEKEVFRLDRGAKEKIPITIEAQLNGHWELGPAEVTYNSQEFGFTVKSNTTTIDVLEAVPSLTLELTVSEVIEEDFEYELKSRLINEGKAAIENIETKVILPGENIAKLTEGSPSRTIFSLNPGEHFEFINKVNFEAGILGKEYKVKLSASYQNGESSTELILSGKNDSA